MNHVDALFSRIEDRRDDLVSLTRDFVAIPTLNPPGDNYKEICEYLRLRLERSGFATSLLRAEGTPGDSDAHPRWNVIARHEGSASGDCVHFNSHTDVVMVGRGWTRDPFGGQVEDGRIFGRGTCDMKGGLSTSIVAAEAFIAQFPEYAGAIEISGTADEESGGFGGVAWMAEHGYFSPERVQHVIIPEPLNKDRICLGHRGLWWAEIRTKGRIAHGSMPFLGDCAIRHMGAVLKEIESYLIPRLTSRTTDMPIVPPAARASTLNINAIHGGEPEQEEEYSGYSASCVPDSCRILIDRRFLAEETIEDVKREVADMLEGIKATRPDFEYEIVDKYEVPFVMTNRNSPIVKTVRSSIRRVLGVEPSFVLSPGTYDQKHIDRIGRLRNCIAYGPGILDLAHQPDEWISIDDMIESAKVMACALVALLTGERTINHEKENLI